MFILVTNTPPIDAIFVASSSAAAAAAAAYGVTVVVTFFWHTTVLHFIIGADIYIMLEEISFSSKGVPSCLLASA